MKQLVLTFGIVMCLCYTTKTFAQQFEKEIIDQEKIILDDKNNESQTSIEIKNGELYIDGNKVSDIDKNTTLKIVKKNTVAENHNFDINRFDKPFEKKSFYVYPKKALLGVLTEDAKPGARINKVIEGSAAEKAGLKAGDIIASINGKSLSTSQELVDVIGEHDKGDEIKIGVKRNTEVQELTAQLTAPQQPSILANDFNSFPFNSLENIIDFPKDMQFFESKSLPSRPKMGLEIEESENGLEVVSVQPNGPSAQAGVQQGDVIETIEGENVQSITDITQQLKNNTASKKIKLGVKRGSARKSLFVVIPQAKKRAQF